MATSNLIKDNSSIEIRTNQYNPYVVVVGFLSHVDPLFFVRQGHLWLH